MVLLFLFISPPFWSCLFSPLYLLYLFCPLLLLLLLSQFISPPRCSFLLLLLSRAFLLSPKMLDSTGIDRTPHRLRTRGAERRHIRLQRKAARSETQFLMKPNEKQNIWGGDNVETCHGGYLPTPGVVLKVFLLLAALSLGLSPITTAMPEKRK